MSAPDAYAVAGVCLGELLGEGGEARVFAGTEADGREVAVKLARSATPAAVQRFAAEATGLRCVGPRAAPALYRTGATADGTPFLVLERLRGESLSARWHRQPGPMSVAEVARLGRAIARCLTEVHDTGLVHGDLSAGNLWLGDDGVRLLDFGRASVAGQPVSARTAAFAAPDRVTSPASDLYAAGVILFRAVTGRLPFDGPAAELVRAHRELLPPRPLALAAMPAALDQLLVDCLAKEPAARPSPAALARRLADLADQPNAAVLASAPQRPAPARPVALLHCDSANAVAIATAAEAGGGQLVRSDAAGALALFDGPDAAARALGCAEAVRESLSARVAVHVARATVRRRRGRLIARGPALIGLDWLPAERGDLLITDQARAALPEAVELPSVGRQHELAELARFVETGLRCGESVLLTVTGAAGVGKSHVIEQLATTLPTKARVIRCNAAPRAGASSPLLGRLLGALGARATPLVDRTLSSRDRQRAARDLVDQLIAVAAQQPLAVVIDGAEQLDHATLDALERATDGAHPIAVILGAAELLHQRRPQLGRRAGRHRHHKLAPLATDDAAALLAELLRPAERVPLAVRRQLARWAGGNPQRLVRLARALRTGGLLRRYPGGGSWYLASDELDRITDSPADRWLIDGELAQLPAEQAELFCRLALLGDDVSADELSAVQRSLAGSRPSAEARAGIGVLISRGLIRAGARGYSATNPALRESAAAMADRPAAVGRAALDYWSSQAASSSFALARRARAAELCGDQAIAVSCLTDLGDRAAARNDRVDAERYYSRALALTTGEARAALLHRRGQVRCARTLYEAAEADASAGLALARSAALRADLLALRGLARDFLDQLSASADDAAAAIELADRAGGATRARVDNLAGVVAARRGDITGAIALLERAASAPAADQRTRNGSRVMLGALLDRVDRAADGHAVLTAAMADCERAGDHFHLAVALFNRVELWPGQPARAAADCRRALAICREMGFDQMEVWGYFSLSQVLLGAGDLDDAVAAAGRCYRLARARFAGKPIVVGPVAYAQLLALTGRPERAAHILTDVSSDDLAAMPWLALAHRGATLAAGTAGDDSWDALVADARAGEPRDLLDALWQRGRDAVRRGANAEAVVALAEAHALAADRDLGCAAVIATDLPRTSGRRAA